MDAGNGSNDASSTGTSPSSIASSAFAAPFAATAALGGAASTRGDNVFRNRLVKLPSATSELDYAYRTGDPGEAGRQLQRPTESLPTGSGSVLEQTEENLTDLMNKLEIESKIKEGAENLLQVFDAKVKKADKERKAQMKRQVESELYASNVKIARLQSKVDALQSRGSGQRATLGVPGHGDGSGATSTATSITTGANTTGRAPLQQARADSHSSLDSDWRGPRLLNLTPFTPTNTTERWLAGSGNEDDEDEEELQRLGCASTAPPGSPVLVLGGLMDDLETASEAATRARICSSIVMLLRKRPMLKEELSIPRLLSRVLSLLRSFHVYDRASALRLLRFSISPAMQSEKQAWKSIVYYIAYVLCKDATGDDSLEKENAFKFIRDVLCPEYFEPCHMQLLVKAVIAVADNADESFHVIAMQSVAELIVLYPMPLIRAGALRVMLSWISEGSQDAALAESFSLPFLYLFDSPLYRRFLIPETDVGAIIAPLVEPNTMPDHEARVRNSAIVTTQMAKTWPGLCALCTNGMRPLRSIIDALRVPHLQVRSCILDLLYDLLEIKHSTFPESLLFAQNQGFFKVFRNATNKEEPDLRRERDGEGPGSRTNLLEQYKALLLYLLFNLDITDSLAVVIETESNMEIVKRATVLLAELLVLANRLMPREYSMEFQSLPRLFATASRFGDQHRFIAITVFAHIDKLSRAMTRGKPGSAQAIGGKYGIMTNAKSNPDPSHSDDRGQRQVNQVKIKMGMQIDGTHFRNMIMETQVLATKKFSTWRWDILAELLQGPLLNPRRLEEAIKATKFMKRLLSFYRPFKYRFCQVKNTRPNQRYVRVGCLLMTTLMSCPEGVKYLMQSKLLRQIAECLAQLDPVSGITAQEPLLSKSRIQETLSGGYLAMIGVLSGHPEGRNMLQNWRMFTILHHIVELTSREDLCILVLESLDYSDRGHCRIILAKAVTTGRKTVRTMGIKHIGRVLAQLRGLSEHPDTVTWMLRLLVTMLYDPDLEVCELAASVLEQACSQDRASLELVVSLRPSIDHLGEIGAPLLLRFLSTSVGYKYLQTLNYVEEEMDDWFRHHNELYVSFVEASITRAMSSDFSNVKEWRRQYDGLAPPHFYGELTKTKEGCALLEEKGHFAAFVQTIYRDNVEEQDRSAIIKLKSCLWAVGHIGSSDGGIPFIKRYDVLPRVVRVAEHSSITSLRGTAYFVLGLLSMTMTGSAMLESVGWICTRTAMGTPTGMCIPRDVSKLVMLPTWSREEARLPDEKNHRNGDGDDNDDDNDDHVYTEQEQQTLSLVADLSSHISANRAALALGRLKSRNAQMFRSQVLLDAVMRMLSMYHYRQAVWRFIFKLFDQVDISASSEAAESKHMSSSDQDDF